MTFGPTSIALLFALYLLCNLFAIALMSINPADPEPGTGIDADGLFRGDRPAGGVPARSAQRAPAFSGRASPASAASRR